MPKINSIHYAVLVKHRLVTDTETHRQRHTERHSAIAYTVIRYRRAVKLSKLRDKIASETSVLGFLVRLIFHMRHSNANCIVVTGVCIVWLCLYCLSDNAFPDAYISMFHYSLLYIQYAGNFVQNTTNDHSLNRNSYCLCVALKVCASSVISESYSK